MGDQNVLSRAALCFKRHVKPVPAAFTVVSTHSTPKGVTSDRRPVVIIAGSLSQHDEKYVVPTPLSGIRIGR
jgi:hypothetical protein